MDSNILGRFVDLVIILVLMFMIPLYYHTSLNDSSVNTYVIREVNLFGDQACKDGYISVEMYEDLLNKLANTDILYDIKLMHTHDVYYPSAGEYVTEEKTYYTDDIRRMLYASDFRSLTNYDSGDYVYGSDGLLYRYSGASNIYPYDPALIGDFDPMTGASATYPYWEQIGKGIQGKYLMQEGDRFSITVNNRSDTTSQKISDLLYFGGSPGIHAYGGGMVSDENYTI